MIANNWATCPKCKKKAQSAVVDAYGKVSEQAYLNLVAEARRAEDDNSLREDYEIYMTSQADFQVIYSCECQVCGFSFQYRHSEKVALT